MALTPRKILAIKTIVKDTPRPSKSVLGRVNGRQGALLGINKQLALQGEVLQELSSLTPSHQTKRRASRKRVKTTQSARG